MKTVVPPTGGPARVIAPDPGAAWVTMFWLGLAAAVIGFTDVAMLWIPPQWANLDWEYGTISASLDSLPLGTIGLGAAVLAAVANGWGRLRIGLGVLELAGALLIAVMTVVLLLDVPVVLRAVEPAMKPVVQRALLKTFIQAFALVFVYGVVGLRALSGARSKGAAR